MTPPPLSVVMPVRNALPYLDEAVESILGQSFADFEFVIRDDGSTDGSTEALREWARRDARIRLFEGEEPLGPAGSSNFVMRRARARLVARMDADDVSRPNRLRRQIELFRARPDAGLVACLWEGIDRAGRRVRRRDRSRLLRRSPFSPFAHGSIMLRRELFEQVGGYRTRCDYWEDIDLYLRLAEAAPLLVITDALYRHRFAETSTRLASGQKRVERAFAEMHRCLDRYGHAASCDDAADEAEARPTSETFVLMGSPSLWAGASPGMLGRLWRSGALSFDRRSAAALVWALWGGASPRGLRLFLRLLLRFRDKAAGRRLGGAAYVEWRPRPAKTQSLPTATG
jgi:glycosyltransferase involved in cell wall biosynthesis